MGTKQNPSKKNVRNAARNAAFSAADLTRAWPDYWATHDISESELERIAERARSVEHAQAIWENDDSWRDAAADSA